MRRCVCIHGHFYQPPRENPWLEVIEKQDSAYPYHDWNERITNECYAPNSAARILDADGRIVRIVDNYRRISFDFGPTLLGWLQGRRPELLDDLVAADRESAERYSGHGSAMAQAFHHTILPLAHPRDKRTEVIWGIRDFRHRFGRDPEGMWLPETAVDTESLEILADQGIAFTILAPRQARRVRPTGTEDWDDVQAETLDTTRPYLARLPSGGEIAVFFFDDRIARETSFGGLLRGGDRLADRLRSAFSDDADHAQLVHVATDGETFGHHRHHGDMALADALERIDSMEDVELTNYAEFLAAVEPTHEVEIVEDSSWSCAHGVERWRSDCGCVTGHQEWSQSWRRPLREALDWLRDELAGRYEECGGELLADPWRARDRYVDVVLDRSTDSIERFFADEASRELTSEERVTALRLLEMQRQTLQMYTSCGWFFDDVSRIETVQVLGYACRALQLARRLLDEDLEPGLVERLAEAPSNAEPFENGRQIYEELVAPSRVDLPRVAAHYAVGNLFGEYATDDDVYAYRVEGLEQDVRESEGRKLAVGRARVTSRITTGSRTSSYAVIHFGAQDLAGWLGAADVELDPLVEAAGACFDSDLAELVRQLDEAFGEERFSLQSLFREEQRKVAMELLEPAVQRAEAAYEELFDPEDPKIAFLEELRVPLPAALKTAARHRLNASLQQTLGDRPLDLARARRLLELAGVFDVNLDSPGLRFRLQGSLVRSALDLAEDPDDPTHLDRLEAIAELLPSMPFEVDLWEPQNLLYRLHRSTSYGRRADATAEGDEDAAEWLERFHAVAESLSLRLEP